MYKKNKLFGCKALLVASSLLAVPTGSYAKIVPSDELFNLNTSVVFPEKSVEKQKKNNKEKSVFTTQNVVIGGLLLAGGGIGVAVLAGGSDDSSSSSNSDSTPEEPPVTPPVTPPEEEPQEPEPETPPITPEEPEEPAVTPPEVTAPRTIEFLAQYGLDTIKADKAYERGYTGQGIKIGVMDSGIYGGHQDIDGNFKAEANFAPSETNKSHGTFVAGIIAAEKDDIEMHGVAYNADIYSAKFIGSSSTNATVNAINYLNTNDVKVVNNSWSIGVGGRELPVVGGEGSGADFNNGNGLTFLDVGFASAEAAAYQNIINQNDAVIVFATGNSGFSQPGIYAALPYYFPNLAGNWVAVGALDRNGNLASFSNKCGVAKDYCVFAPGVNVYSSYNGTDNYARLSGTSAAAPHVSGAVALLAEAYPYLSGSEILNILFQTSTDLGEVGVDEIYGHGLINLDAATQPIGTPAIATTNSLDTAIYNAASSSINLGSAFGDALSTSNLNIATFDDYKRVFTTKLNDFVSLEQKTSGLQDEIDRYGLSYFDKNIQLDKLQASFTKLEPEKYSLEQYQDKDYYSQLSYGYENIDISVGFNTDISKTMGFAKVSGYDNNLSLLKNKSSNGFFGLAESSYNLGANYDYSKNLSFAVISGFTTEDEQSSSNITMGELNYKQDWLNIALQLGVVNEQQGFLGSNTQGAFSTNNSSTSFVGLGLQAQITKNTSLFGLYNYGISNIDDASSSLLTSFDNVTSDSFSLGLVSKNIIANKDELGLSLSQPLRVKNAVIGSNLPVARTNSGEVLFNSQKLNLAPKGQELDLELYYKNNISHKTDLNLTALYRHEPNNVQTADPEGLFMFKLRHKY